MVQTVKKKRTNFKPLEGLNKIDRYLTGSGSKSNFMPKETSPGVMSIKMPEVVPSKPQAKERLHAGGTKARLKRKSKNRRAVAATDPHDPGQVKFASTKVHWPINDANAKKGYKVGSAWKSPKISAVHSDSPSVTAPHK